MGSVDPRGCQSLAQPDSWVCFPGCDTLGVWLDLPRVRRYLTYMKTTVSSKGQIVLPAELRQMDRVEPGQEFEVERLDRGDYRLVRRAARQNEGVIDWLLACPRKDFFVPIDSESTDAL
jgi:AbrB family looped-hinge helix DNA binding protein